MPIPPRYEPSPRRRRRFFTVLSLGIAAITAIWGAGTVVGDQDAGSTTALARPPLRVLAGDRVIVELPVRSAGAEQLEQELRAKLPDTAVLTRGLARIKVRYRPAATVRAAAEQMVSGGDVQAIAEPYAARVPAPVVQQEQRNSCESAALHILLATLGRNVSQAALQGALPVSGDPDPISRDGEKVWGDPDLGYVGRPAGGGVAGGFGTYPGPVRKAAAKFDVALQDLTGQGPQAVYRRLLAGRAVITWIGLSEGPYGQWTSPQGKSIRVNFGEHTVVLHGIDADGLLEVSNPLQATRERWTKSEFEVMYKRLGLRAVAAR